jgi:hypothetical protein
MPPMAESAMGGLAGIHGNAFRNHGLIGTNQTAAETKRIASNSKFCRDPRKTAAGRNWHAAR